MLDGEGAVRTIRQPSTIHRAREGSSLGEPLLHMAHAWDRCLLQPKTPMLGRGGAYTVQNGNQYLGKRLYGKIYLTPQPTLKTPA